MNPWTQLGVADYNQKFLDALEHVDDIIQSRQHIKVSVWRSMIQRGSYTLGEGLVKKVYRFHPGLGDQRGLQKWRAIQISSVAAGEDPGVDACAYNPYLVDYGFETVSYTGFQTERRTRSICIKDIRFTWQFRQQLELIMSFLGDITNSVWENYAREMYTKFAVDAGNGYVLARGAPNQHNFAYDPFSVDADGDNVLTIAVSQIPGGISTLNWTYFRWLSRWLEMACPLGSIGNDAQSRPLYGWVGDMEDFDNMVIADDSLREDFRYYSPRVLIENYGSVQTFKGFSLMHDLFAPRFKIKSNDGTTLTLKRVDPMLDIEAVTLGNKVTINPDYLNAEFALAVIFVKNVFRVEVPPAGPSAPGGGTSFGATPSLNGQFKWINNADNDDNLLNEVGFYFGRYEAFAKPLENDEYPVVVLYRRCVNTNPGECDTCGSDQAAEATSIGLASDAASDAVDSDNDTLTLVLSQCLGCEAGEGVTVTDDDGGTINGIIADSSQAPTYVFALQSEPNVYTKYTAAGVAAVVCR